MKLYQNKEWLEKQLKEVKYKDEIGRNAGVTGDTISYWIKKFGLKYNKDLPPKIKKYSHDESFFQVIDTEEKAYWLGFIMADGCITSTSRKFQNNVLDIILKSTDLNHLEKLKKALKSNHKIKIKKQHDKRGFSVEECELKISSKKTCAALIKNQVLPRKTGKEILPDTVPEQYRKDFFRGFFDGDGCISKSSNRDYARVFLGSCSLKIINQFKIFLEENEIKELTVSVRKYYSKPFYYIETNSKIKSQKIMNLLYKNANVFLERKYALAKKFAPLKTC